MDDDDEFCALCQIRMSLHGEGDGACAIAAEKVRILTMFVGPFRGAQ